MRLVYANENSVLVSIAKNMLTNHGLAVFVQNEHSSTGGHVQLAHRELWIKDDADYKQAIELIGTLNGNNKHEDWACSSCDETNDASFEVCWNCSAEVLQQE